MIIILRAIITICACIIISSTIVSAENSLNLSPDNDKFYFGVYLILFFATLGWIFFLVLLGIAIFQAVPQFRNLKFFSLKSVRKKRVKCK